MTEDTRPSKSQKKRDVEALQKLGERLLALRETDLGAIPLSDKLREALRLGKSITSHGALRRHKQYIGKLMRSENSEAIAVAVEQLQQPDRDNIARQHSAERWRDRLLEPADNGLTDFLKAHPQANQSALEELISAAKSADQNRSKRAKRELFRVILASIG